ncbi:hypothetical protein GUITHDRAFT_153675, partial [Guillardia theta CCMP2712]
MTLLDYLFLSLAPSASSFVLPSVLSPTRHHMLLQAGAGRPRAGTGDCGDLKRLEKFGELTVCRPCPSAIWQPRKGDLWKSIDLEFSTRSADASKRGSWEGMEQVPADWSISFEEVDIRFSLAPSDQGQIGIFPEQKSNWKWIRETMRRRGSHDE